MVKRSLALFVVLALLFAFGVAPAEAARSRIRTSQPIETTGVFNDESGNAMSEPTWVYGYSIYADAASSYMGVYDCDTLNEINAATIYPKYEIGEPTQYEITTEWLEYPQYFADGVAAIIFTGVGFVHYGPEPTS